MRDQIFDLQRRYGSLAAYANKITRTERSESGEDVERKIPFLKGHTVFNVEQIDGLPDHYSRSRRRALIRSPASSTRSSSFAQPAPTSAMAAGVPSIRRPRILSGCRRSDAIEELVAELGAAFLCASLELTLEPREEHASYIQNWLTVLRNDKRAIFQAAAHAQRAADFLHQLQPTAGEGDERPIAPLPPAVAAIPAEAGAS